MWVFGYGSLVWYTNFDYDKIVLGHIKGFSRRFWQASPDHRGTPDNPGRTVTLIEDDKGRVSGVAYHITTEKETEVRDYLNWREKAGYELRLVTFYPNDNDFRNHFSGSGYSAVQTSETNCWIVEVYISPSEDNQYFVGPEDSVITAEIITSSMGPSGKNLDYFRYLLNFLRKHDAEEEFDPYLIDLEAIIISICKEKHIEYLQLK